MTHVEIARHAMDILPDVSLRSRALAVSHGGYTVQVLSGLGRQLTRPREHS